MGSAAGCVSNNDERGRLDAALRDAEQGAHAELAHAVLIEDFAFEAAFRGHFAGAVGEDQRGQNVGGFIGEVAGEILRFGEDLAAEKSLIERGSVGGGDGVEGVERFSLIGGFVQIGLEISEDGAFGDGFGVSSIQPPGEALHAFLLQRADHGGDGFAQIEFIALPSPDDSDAFRGETGGLMEHGELVGLAGKFAGGFELVEPGGGELQLGGRGLVLKKNDGHGIGVDFVEGLIQEFRFH